MEFLELLFQRWAVIMFRATIVLGPLFLIFWVLRPRVFQAFRIAQPRIAPSRMRQEVINSILSLSTYLIPTIAVVIAAKKFGYTVMYRDINQYGLPYFFLSIGLFAIVTDTWFYWLHRIMHENKILFRYHAVHHRSYNINPLSSYSFHMVEALLNMLSYLIIVMCIPWHPLALTIFGILGILQNGYLHLGYDAPAWLREHRAFRWIYTGTHHSAHHHHLDGNYANYFMFWDRLMGTEMSNDPAGVKSCAK